MLGHFMANVPKPTVFDCPMRSGRKPVKVSNELVIDLTNDSD